MVYVSRIAHFNAAHKLYNESWSKEKNEEIFGACANENWHGHNFQMTVTVKGAPNPMTGFVYDLKKLGDLIEEHIIEQVDHKNLNLDVPFFKGKMTSCETIVKEFWRILEPLIKSENNQAQLHSIKLIETSKNYVEYFG